MSSSVSHSRPSVRKRLASLHVGCNLLAPPNGTEMSRPASQAQYRINGADPAGRVGSIELLGRLRFGPGKLVDSLYVND